MECSRTYWNMVELHGTKGKEKKRKKKRKMKMTENR